MQRAASVMSQINILRSIVLKVEHKALVLDFFTQCSIVRVLLPYPYSIPTV